jgi:hypothetical protein
MKIARGVVVLEIFGGKKYSGFFVALGGGGVF